MLWGLGTVRTSPFPVCHKCCHGSLSSPPLEREQMLLGRPPPKAPMPAEGCGKEGCSCCIPVLRRAFLHTLLISTTCLSNEPAGTAIFPAIKAIH